MSDGDLSPNQERPMAEFLNRHEAARRLKISVRLLDYLRERGELDWVRFGTRGVRFTTEQLMDCARRRTESRRAAA